MKLKLLEEYSIEGLKLFAPRVFQDERGHFLETFNQEEFSELGVHTQFVQDNQSLSQYGTIRGLHLQKRASAQAKLVRVAYGEVLDVAVDLRPNSPTFGKHVSVHLSSENFYQFYIPKGFAHGFSVLSKEALFLYKCDHFYDQKSEGGLRFDDPELNIDWKVPKEKQVVSSKDMELPLFNQIKKEEL